MPLRKKFSRVGLIGVAVVITAVLLGDFVVLRPNRLAPGEHLSMFESVVFWQSLLVMVVMAVITSFSWRPGRRQAGVALYLIPSLFLVLLWFQGNVARQLVEQEGQFARVSFGSAFWLALLGLFMIFTDMVQRRAPAACEKLIVFLLICGGIVWLGAAGVLNKLSLVMEFSSRSDRFLAELGSHLFITGLSVGFSAAVGLPLGTIAFKYEKIRDSAFSVLNIIQTLPSLALFGLLIAPLAFISNQIPLLRSMGIGGIGWAPAVIALTLYALLPIVRNTFSGFSAVDPHLIEAGEGLGMGRSQMFFRVELPIAAPIILNGLRIASVQSIGNTAVAALIGAGGFGVFIFQGLGQSAIDLVLLGAVPTIFLAVLADYVFQGLIAVITPKGLS